MSGIIHDVATNLEWLRALLREYTLGERGITILKELAQNADDAGARRLSFVLFDEGTQDTENSLLRGPGLLVFNDGPFHEEHAHKFVKSSGTSKRDDTSAIGRFGFGLKSVFHLCDAWLWIGRTPEGSEIYGVLDPFADPTRNQDEERPDWNQVTECDLNALRAAVGGMTPRQGSWLGQWLPLRQAHHQRETYPPLVDYVWTVDELARDFADLSPLVDLMPQLANLERIEARRAQRLGVVSEVLAAVDRHPASGHLGRYAPEAARGEWRKGGKLTVSGPAGKSEYHYWMVESLVDDPQLGRLLRHERWPSVSHEVHREGKWTTEKIKDKAIPHGAVTVVRAVRDENVRHAWPPPGLGLGWAAYLPMGATTSRAMAEDRRAWSIRLHGAFFPDHARRAPQGLKDSLESGESHIWLKQDLDPASARDERQPLDDWFRAAWNRRLAAVVTLPLLVPALEEALKSEASAQEAEEALRALTRHPLVLSAAGPLTQRAQLALRVTSTSEHVQLIAADARVVGLPRVTRGGPAWTGIVRDGIRRMESLDAPPVLSWMDAPAVLRTPGFAALSDLELEALLGREAISDLKISPDATCWIADLLQQVAGSDTERAAGWAQRVLAEVLAAHRSAHLRHASTKEHWRRVAALIPPNRRIETSAWKALDLLPEQVGEVLILPRECYPVEATAGGAARRWLGRDWHPLFKTLHEAATRDEPLSEDVIQEIGVLAADIMVGVGLQGVLSDPTIRNLRLFSVRSSRFARRVLVDTHSLKGPLAFHGVGMARPESVADRLFRCIAGNGHDVLVVSDAQLARSLGIHPLTEDRLVECFLHNGGPEPVSDPKVRAELLESVLTPTALATLEEHEGANGPRPGLRRGLRLLLAGDRKATISEDHLLVQDGQSSLSEIGARAVLDLSGQGWHLIPEVLLGSVTQPWRRALGIRTLDAVALIGQLRDHAPERLQTLCDALTESDRDGLQLICADEREVWRSLPVHATVGGTLCAGSSAGLVRLTLDLHPDPVLARGIQQVRVSQNPRVAQLQIARIEAWGPAKAARVGLQIVQEEKATSLGLARAILDALGRLTETDLEGLKGALNTTPWLPRDDGVGIRPIDVLRVPATLARLARSLLPGREDCFVLPAELPTSVQEHGAFDQLMRLGGDGVSDAVDALALRIADAGANLEPYILAPSVAHIAPLELALACRSTLSADGGWAVLLEAMDALGRDVSVGYPRLLVESLTGAMKPPRLVALLGRVQGSGDSVIDSSDVARLHQHMLQWVRYDGPMAGARIDVLTGIKLPSVSGRWSSPKALTAIENARSDYALHGAWASALGLPAGIHTASEQVVTPPGRVLVHELANARARVEAYFQRWHSCVPQQALGLFLTFLGDGVDGELVALAQSWLGITGTVSNIRYDATIGSRNRTWTAGEPALQNTGRAQLAIEVLHDGTVIWAPNLLGERIEVPVGSSGHLKSLLIGGLRCSTDPQWLLLADLNPSMMAPEELLRLLREASHGVYVRLTGYQAGPSLDLRWDEIEKGGQVDAQVTRRLIQRELPTQLRLLGLAGDEEVARKLSAAVSRCKHYEQALDELDVADERDHAHRGSRVHRRVKAQEEHRGALQRLEHLVETDDAHLFLLGRVRSRLQDEQYDKDRVPFELFQNADDALAQLVEMLNAEGQELPTEARTFIVEAECSDDASVARFWHWGRAINRHYLGPSFLRGRELGYDQDLLHMMLLHASSKSAQDRATGRFGLGFKSVHLVSNRVMVQSGRLAFLVRAGFLPDPCPAKPTWIARSIEGTQPTVIELGLDCSIADLLSTFTRVAALLPVFAQAISTVELRGGSAAPTQYRWRPRSVDDSDSEPRITVGDVLLDRQARTTTRLLVISGASSGSRRIAFAVALVAGRLAPIPDDIPTMWCTAPTSLAWRTGWCLNGPFQVDVGRAQLGRTAHHLKINRAIAEQAGRLVAEALAHVDTLVRSSLPSVGGLLDMPVAQGAPRTLEALWASAWAQLGEGLTRRGTDQVEHEILRSFSQGWFGAFARERRIPTELAGGWGGLTTLSDIRWIADPALSREPIATTVSRWPWVAEDQGQGTVVHPDVSERLSKIKPEWEKPVLTLAELIRAAWRDAPSADVVRLAALHPVYQWLNDYVPPLPQAVLESTRAALRDALFPSAHGAAQPARRLVVPSLSDSVRAAVRAKGGERAAKDLDLIIDEHLLAAFAPPTSILGVPASGSADALLVYLEARRDEKGIEITDLVEWAHLAAQDEQRRAVVQYLAQGERAQALGKKLAASLPIWAPGREAMERAGLLNGLAEDALARVIALLFPREVVAGGRSRPGPAVSPPLRAIYDWWMREGDRHIQDFHEREWPEEWHDRKRLGRVLGTVCTDGEGLDAWMTFLLLGALRSLGRSQPAHHKGFIKSLKEQGAWDVFLQDPRKHPERWTEALREWEDRARDQPRFQRWWMFFPVAHQLRGHVEVYARVLLRLGRPEWLDKRLQVRVSPRVAEEYSGAGLPFDAPFLPVGIGLHWLVREMSRLQVEGLPGSAAALGWVPDAQLRRIFAGIGVELSLETPHDEAARRFSAAVGQAGVADISMGGSYCIPLRIIAENPDIAGRLPVPISSSPDDDGLREASDWESEE